jgi:hypothetical protein
MRADGVCIIMRENESHFLVLLLTLIPLRIVSVC